MSLILDGDGSISGLNTITDIDAINISQANITGIATFGSDVQISDVIEHTGDTDTRIRFPAADTFTVETAGSERIRVDSTGNVGIGTDAPFTNSALHISRDTFYDLTLERDGASAGICTIGNRGNQLRLSNNVDGIRFDTGNGNNNIQERIRITSGGDVGIGTINPLGTGALTNNTATLAVGVATVGALHVNSTPYPSMGPLSNRNMIINGGMMVAQRGTTVAGTGYCVDRFQINASGLDQAAFTQRQSSTVPAGFSSSFQLDITTAETTIDADEQCQLTYRMEGQDVQQFESGLATAKDITLSFYVRSNIAATYAIGIFKNDANRAYTANYTINSADTWERKIITIPGDTTGTIPATVDNEFSFHFFLAAGTDRTSGSSTLNQWGAFALDSFASGHTANVLSSTDNEWFITGVQLELGSVATPFEYRTFNDELGRCQRYYEIGGTYHTSDTATNAFGRTDIHYSVRKRAVPTLTINVTTGSAGTTNQNGASGFCYQAPGALVGDSAEFNFTSESELT